MENRFQYSFKARQQTERRSLKKQRLIFLSLTILLGLVLLRAFYLQVFQANSYDQLVRTKNQQLKSIPVQKGSITTSDGEILAASVPSFSAYIDPSAVTNPKETAMVLSSLLGLDANNLHLDPNKHYVGLKRYLTNQEKAALDAHKLDGVVVVRDFKRVYPGINQLSNILGFSGQGSVGLEGLEFKFEKFLSQGKSYPGLADRFYNTNLSNTTGGNLVLTIDDRIQTILEREVQHYAIGTDALQALSLVLDSKTGAILGAASYPDYNPNAYEQYNSILRQNTFISNIYEPGSTFKIVTLSIALEEGWVKSDEKFDCQMGHAEFFHQPIKDTSPLGWADLALIIQKSSNICAAQIGLKIPPENFYKGITKFGFLKKTGVEMSGESDGQLRDFTKWKPLDQAILSYGHGIGVTPLQMISALNVLANDGEYIPPYLVAKMVDSNGKTFVPDHLPSHRAISQSTAAKIKQYMLGVVSNQGSGSLAQIPGLVIAGKTGTTEKFDKRTGKYSTIDVISSFIGFFPADHPKYTILTLVNNPKRPINGHSTGAALFNPIAKGIWRIRYPEELKEAQQSHWYNWANSSVEIPSGLKKSKDSYDPLRTIYQTKAKNLYQ